MAPRSPGDDRSPLRLRQVAAIAADLDETVDAAAAVLGVEVGFRDPGSARYGLVNAILVLGDTFLEVVSPIRTGTTAERFLRRRGPSAGYMICLQAPEEIASAARLTGLGARVIENLAYDGGRTLHLHPKDVGGPILSLDACRPPQSWHWAGPNWRDHAGNPSAIVAAELRGLDPEDLACRWGRAVGRPATRRDAGWVVALDRGELRFGPVHADGAEGFFGLEVATPDPAGVRARAEARELIDAAGEIRLCGLRVGVVAG